MRLTPADREARRSGLGGSDCPSVFGVGYHSRYALYYDKVHGLVDRSNPFQERGHDLEELVARKAAAELGVTEIVRGGRVDHPEHDWMFANLDFEIPSLDAILECKVTDFRFKGDNWRDGPPVDIHLQACHQLIVTGKPVCYVAVLFVDTWKLDDVHEVTLDDDLAEQIVDAEQRFWFDHVIARRPPEMLDPLAAWETQRLLESFGGPKVELSSDQMKIVEQWQQVRAERLEYETAEKHLKGQVAAMVGDATEAVHGGRTVLTFDQPSTGRGSRRLNYIEHEESPTKEDKVKSDG